MNGNEILRKMAVSGVKAAGGAVVEGVSGVLKDEMEERDLGKANIDALDKVTDVCRDMVPDMAGKVVTGLIDGNTDQKALVD